jgi:hypothetical protein
MARDLQIKEIEQFLSKQPSPQMNEDMASIIYSNNKENSNIFTITIDGVRVDTDKLSDTVISQIIAYIRQVMNSDMSR